MRLRAASMSANVTTSLTLEGCLRRCQSRNGNPEWAAAHVIQTEPVTEFNARGLTPMFAADSKFNLWPSFSAQVPGDFHQSPNAFLVNRRERIRINNIKLRVSRQKNAGIVPAHSQCRLGKIVCAKTEELSVARDLVRDECSARDFDHRSDEIIEFGILFLRYFAGDAAD